MDEEALFLTERKTLPNIETLDWRDCSNLHVFSTTTSDDANLQITVRSNNKVARLVILFVRTEPQKVFPIGNGFCVEDPVDGKPPHCWNRGGY
ncbi:hypothetical protein CDAR_287041 [Caerostris darwini]|uniref:Uncharacterized protein n=1 Tax=Caerostris darwini TaxID=1538125 RepID=A0AAV4REM4_9ARAC|nr:hypothetical protein CDAR_287041 [Caerostris darwini]